MRDWLCSFVWSCVRSSVRLNDEWLAVCVVVSGLVCENAEIW